MDARELYLLGLLVVIFPAAHGADHGMSNPTLTGCECTGGNLALGTAEMTKHGADYGKWCSAWEDGQCDSTATRGPAHTCKGNQASSCQAHWPSYDFDDDQSWCCDSWCYVSNITCTPEKQKQYGITIGESWTKTNLWYSVQCAVCSVHGALQCTIYRKQYAVCSMQYAVCSMWVLVWCMPRPVLCRLREER